MRPNKPTRRAFGLGIAALFAVSGGGCGYTVRPPYDPNIRTVYVPIFRSVTFRRDLNLMLTEAVIKEIGRRTPYHVVGTPEGADTTLDGTINFSDKNIIVPSPVNLPRQLSTLVIATVTWTDNTVAPEDRKDTNPAVVSEMFNFFPELGDTTQAAFAKCFDKLAIQIVNMMEEPW
ncbi:LPS assembly lipoprotein LptE [Tundrisphaera sp. TA3]|uniref:LPS assembly lipoprotein LptE n=1 Tax=Tundrisphaera sp. TA3 TaxID=3435775 RepID=UPI003EC0A205